MMRHCTPAKNLASIMRSGLLCSKSRGRLKAVWLATPARTNWAILHTVKRHGGRVETTVVLEVAVPRGWMRHSRRGLSYTLRDVPASRIMRVYTFTEIAGPSTAA
jgi:hypothetical protein